MTMLNTWTKNGRGEIKSEKKKKSEMGQKSGKNPPYARGKKSDQRKG